MMFQLINVCFIIVVIRLVSVLQVCEAFKDHHLPTTTMSGWTLLMCLVLCVKRCLTVSIQEACEGVQPLCCSDSACLVQSTHTSGLLKVIFLKLQQGSFCSSWRTGVATATGLTTSPALPGAPVPKPVSWCFLHLLRLFRTHLQVATLTTSSRRDSRSHQNWKKEKV